MSLLRLIVWGLIFYIIMKVVRNISSAFKVAQAPNPQQKTESTKKTKLSIDKKDIIEAEFEEVRSEKDSK